MTFFEFARSQGVAYAAGQSVNTQYTLDLLQNAQPLTATSDGNSTLFFYGLGPVAQQTDSMAYPLMGASNTPRQLVDE